MAVTTLSQAATGALPPYDISKNGAAMKAAGVLHSLIYSSGSPGAAVAPSPGMAGAALTSYAGQIPFSNPIAGADTHLYRLSLTGTQPGKAILFDRLWHNSGIVITTTTAQTVNSVQWPARCVAGGRLFDANGGFIQVALEASSAIGGGAVSNTTISYTNQAGVAGRTGTMPSWPGTAVAGTFVPFQLQAGDTGIRSVQSITLGTSYVSGAVHLVAYRRLADLPMQNANGGYAIDMCTGGLPQLPNDSVPFLVWHPSSTTAVSLNGSITFTQA